MPLWTRRRASNRSRQSPGGRALSTVRTKDSRVARRAQPGREHLVAWHARVEQHVARRRPSIEEPVLGSPRLRKSRHRRIVSTHLRRIEEPTHQLILAKAGRFELPAKIEPDLVAAGAYRWTERDQKIVGHAAKLARHRRDHRRGNAGRHSTPSCVRGRDRSGAPVGDKQRHTVCGLDGESEVRPVGHDDVGILPDGLGPGVPCNQHRTAVHLSRPYQPGSIEAQASGGLGPGLFVTAGGSRAKLPAARGKKVSRHVRQRPADQRRTAAALNPFESLARLRKI